MFKLALRQLRLDPSRTLLTALVLGAVIAVILILAGFEQGQYYQLSRIVLKRQADLVLTQSGVSNFIAVRSSLPQTTRDEVEAVDGVVNANPLTALPVIYAKGKLRTPIYVLVYDTIGGPASIKSGRQIKQGREIVIDESLAKKYGIKTGDDFLITDFRFTVVGITNEAAFLMPFAFINYDGMLDLFIESEIAPDLSTFPLLSFLLVELKPQADRDKVAAMIEQRVPAVDVFTPEKLADRDVNMGRLFFGPIMGLLVSVGYIIGILVVGLIMYADVRGRIKSFAVLKALGFPARRLNMAVLYQSVLLLALAAPLGAGAAYILALFIESAAPVYYIYLAEPGTLATTMIASLAFAVIGALVPLRTIHRSDPMIVFQGA